MPFTPSASQTARSGARNAFGVVEPGEPVERGDDQHGLPPTRLRAFPQAVGWAIMPTTRGQPMRDATQALLVIDVQNDFCPGGALAVPGGDEIVPGINALMAEFPPSSSRRTGTPPTISASPASIRRQGADGDDRDALRPAGALARPLRAGQQGAEFHPDLDTTRADLIIRKGFRREIDSYSAFFENDQRPRQPGSKATSGRAASHAADLVGLATDFCVNFSAVDAAKLGFRSRCAAISPAPSTSTDLSPRRRTPGRWHDPRRRRPHLILRMAPKPRRAGTKGRKLLRGELLDP
jgi:nicotinamidase/pyrazinamidase